MGVEVVLEVAYFFHDIISYHILLDFSLRIPADWILSEIVEIILLTVYSKDPVFRTNNTSLDQLMGMKFTIRI